MEMVRTCPAVYGSLLFIEGSNAGRKRTPPVNFRIAAKFTGVRLTPLLYAVSHFRALFCLPISLTIFYLDVAFYLIVTHIETIPYPEEQEEHHECDE